MASELTRQALDISGGYVDSIVELTMELTQIGAPTFEEAARARKLEEVLRNSGYDAVLLDEISNVIARIPGRDRSKALLVAAHIDTVFPLGTDLTVRQDGDTLHAPGIGDNTVAVAAVAHLKQAFEELNIVPAIDIIVAGNVGEEGLGDLRGMKAVMDANPDIVGALAIEGTFLGRITNVAVGSRRYKVKVTGSGGHSWGDAGVPSAIHHLARMITEMDDIPLSAEPQSSFNAGILEGGISVNTIAPEAEAILDMRSADPDALAAVVDAVEKILAMETPDGISVDYEIVGDRPAGSYDPNGVLMQIASEVLSEVGYKPHYYEASTDANVPIGRGIPAVCIGITQGKYLHRLDEYIYLSPIAAGFAQMVSVAVQAAEALAE